MQSRSKMCKCPEKGRSNLKKRKYKIRITERKRRGGFRRIFTVAFLPFLAPAGGSNPAGPIS